MVCNNTPHFSYFAVFIPRPTKLLPCSSKQGPQESAVAHALGTLESCVLQIESSAIDPCLQVTHVFDLTHPVKSSPKYCVYHRCDSPQIYHKLVNFTCPGACHKHFA